MRKILFVELLGGIGDILIALAAIQALARSHPDASITVLTFSSGASLLKTDPLINRVVFAKQGKAKQSLIELLASESFDLIVSDTNYENIAGVIEGSGTKRVVTNLWRQPPPDERVGDRFVSILQTEGLISQDAIQTPQLHLSLDELINAEKLFNDIRRPLVFLCPDAGMAIKRWSDINFIKLGQALQQRWGATVIVPVGEDERQAVAIAKNIGGEARILPRGKLRDLAASLACGDLVVGADTGPVRIAAALNVPTITLFGPSWYGRYGQPSPHINLQGFAECPERNIGNFTEQRCWFSGTCPLDKGWESCMEAISVDEVLDVVFVILNEPPRRQDRQEEENKESKIPNPKSKILVLRLDNIGDVIMTSPALRAIKENLPDCHLTLMASTGGAQAAPLLPWVDEVLPVSVLWQDLGKLDFDPAREWELVRTLQDGKYDAAIIFTSFSQSPHPPAFICYLARIPLRVGESKELGSGVLTVELSSAPDEIHQVERNLRLIEAIGFKVRSRSLVLGSFPHSPLPTPHPPYILLNPWTSCQSRNYDSQRFAIAALQLANLTGLSVVVTGVEKDRPKSGLLLEILGDCAIDLIGKTTLEELAGLIANAKLVLTNNTSTMHLADATRTPTVVMFAGTELECQWEPRNGTSRLLRRPTPCSPCYAFTCPYQLECLDIPPEEVVAAGLELLKLPVPS